MARQKLITCPADGWRFLAASVLFQSKRDLLGEDPLAALDSLCWWVFGDGPDLAEALGIYKTPSEILLWILGGCENGEGSEIN